MMNVALPTIGSALGGGTAGLQWCANGYAIAFASLLLPAGALADGLGARRVLLLGTGVFAGGVRDRRGRARCSSSSSPARSSRARARP